ncbi:hypothetical protein [Roseibium album]|uniref:hypothetical protein n=1 Tax=Roseibium album TaxID=311410 RepID=UPI00391B4D1D
MPMSKLQGDNLEGMQKKLAKSCFELEKEGRDDENSLLMQAMNLLIENELRKDNEERRKNFRGQ